MEYYLFDDWEIVIDKSIISHILKTININYKNLKHKSKERSQLCRDLYHLEISQFVANLLIFINESIVNKQKIFEKWGYIVYELSPIVT